MILGRRKAPEKSPDSLPSRPPLNSGFVHGCVLLLELCAQYPLKGTTVPFGWPRVAGGWQSELMSNASPPIAMGGLGDISGGPRHFSGELCPDRGGDCGKLIWSGAFGCGRRSRGVELFRGGGVLFGWGERFGWGLRVGGGWPRSLFLATFGFWPSWPSWPPSEFLSCFGDRPRRFGATDQITTAGWRNLPHALEVTVLTCRSCFDAHSTN
jgi:hypothetical protein